MKQNFFMAALLAAMLAIAGCGGGSSSSSSDTNTTTETPKTKAQFSTAIGACTTEACVTGLITQIEGSTLSEADKTELKSEADGKIAMLDTDPSLTDSELAASFELLDALATSSALTPGNPYINTDNAELKTGSIFLNTDKKAFADIGGWTGASYNIPNPEGVSGEVHDLRIWTENTPYMEQKYVEFFLASATANPEALGVTRDETFLNSGGMGNGRVNIPAVPIDSELARALPQYIFTRPFTPGFIDIDNDGSATSQWVLSGNLFGVSGTFVCLAGKCLGSNTVNPDQGATADPIGAGGTIADNDITFIPSQFGENGNDASDIHADFAKVPDPKFLSFGSYWNTQIDPDGKVTSIRVDPFAGGAEAYVDTEAIIVSGQSVLTATYEGGAAGVYVRTMKDANDDIVGTGWGEFNATASVEAKFSASKDTLSATFNNFKRIGTTGSGQDPADDWELKFSGDIDAGKVNNDDSFHASFQGAVRMKDGQPETIGRSGARYAPYGIVGTFQSGAQLDNGSVTGAFGAECRGTNCSANN